MASYVPPRDAYEFQVVVTAQQAIASADIGVFDDLVELGLGLPAASFMAERLGQLLGRRLLAREICDARTAAQIASAYRMRPKAGPWSSLVTIREVPGGLPLVFVHPIGGNAFWYLSLCKKLGGHHGLYALHARGLDLMETPHRAIEEMAGAYANDLRAAVANGPYVLVGWSFGGLVAFEIARQLTAAGAHVPLVVLFDIGPYDQQVVPATEQAAWGLLIHALRLDRAAGRLMTLPSRERALEVLQRATQSYALPSDTTVADIERMFDLNLIHLAAIERYEAGGYESDILVFFSADRSPAQGDERSSLGWESVTRGDVRAHRLPGTHFDALVRANQSQIARRIEAELAGLRPNQEKS